MIPTIEQQIEIIERAKRECGGGPTYNPVKFLQAIERLILLLPDACGGVVVDNERSLGAAAGEPNR